MDVHTNIYDEFSCIGDRCKRNCCQGWTINLDADTTAYYKSLDDEFGRFIQSKLEDTDDGGSKFALGKCEKCPAQTDDGLCEIYIRYGEEHLSKTCAMFPRYHVGMYGDNGFRYLCNECEEVLRILYDRNEKLDLIIEAKDKKDLSENLTMFDFAQLIAWCVDFIQDESVPLWNSVITTMHIVIEASGSFLKDDMDGFQSVIETIPTVSEAYSKAIEGITDDILEFVAWEKVRLISVAYLDTLNLTDLVAVKDMFPVEDKYTFGDPGRGDQLKKAYGNFRSHFENHDEVFFRRLFANQMVAFSFDILKDESRDTILYEYAPKLIISLTVPSLWSDMDLKDRDEFFSKMAMLQRMSKKHFMSYLSKVIKEQMKPDITEYAVMFAGLLGRD